MSVVVLLTLGHLKGWTASPGVLVISAAVGDGGPLVQWVGDVSILWRNDR